MATVLFLPVYSSAQETDSGQVHWAYASFLGTGWYKLDGNREVYILRAPLRWYYQEASIDESGGRQLGIEFHFPLTFGLHKLEELEDFVDIDNIGTLSFNPGIEIEYPISERWRLRAYGHAGWGIEVETSDSAWIFDAGVKSRFAFQHGDLDWAVVNEVFFAAYNEKQGKQITINQDNLNSDTLSGLMAGLDFSHPVAWTLGGSHPLKLKWDVSYRWFQTEPLFSRLNSRPDKIDDEWEIGLAIARQDGPIKIWFFNFEHLGLSYRFDSSGDFQAITMNFRSPFTR